MGSDGFSKWRWGGEGNGDRQSIELEALHVSPPSSTPSPPPPLYILNGDCIMVMFLYETNLRCLDAVYNLCFVYFYGQNVVLSILFSVGLVGSNWICVRIDTNKQSMNQKDDLNSINKSIPLLTISHTHTQTMIIQHTIIQHGITWINSSPKKKISSLNCSETLTCDCFQVHNLRPDWEQNVSWFCCFVVLFFIIFFHC